MWLPPLTGPLPMIAEQAGAIALPDDGDAG